MRAQRRQKSVPNQVARAKPMRRAPRQTRMMNRTGSRKPALYLPAPAHPAATAEAQGSQHRSPSANVHTSGAAAKTSRMHDPAVDVPHGVQKQEGGREHTRNVGFQHAAREDRKACNAERTVEERRDAPNPGRLSPPSRWHRRGVLIDVEADHGLHERCLADLGAPHQHHRLDGRIRAGT